MRRAATVCLVVGACALAVAGAPAGAQTGGGDLGPDSVRATAADFGGGTFPGSGLPARAPSVESPYTWSRSPSSMVCLFLTGPLPPEVAGRVLPIPGPTSVSGTLEGPGTPLAPAGAVMLERPLVPPDAVVVGDLVYEVGVSPGRAIVVPRCVTPDDPPLGDPPSPAEVWEQTPLPRTRVHASPPGTPTFPGLTRFATLFWGEALPDAVAHVALRGFDVTVVAHPVAYAWSFGDGTSTVRSDPGSATEPLRATFLRRGDYGVDLYVVWQGRAHMTFAGLDVADADLGTVTVPEHLPYHVAEVRAVLRTTPGRR